MGWHAAGAGRPPAASPPLCVLESSPPPGTTLADGQPLQPPTRHANACCASPSPPRPGGAPHPELGNAVGMASNVSMQAYSTLRRLRSAAYPMGSCSRTACCKFLYRALHFHTSWCPTGPGSSVSNICIFEAKSGSRVSENQGLASLKTPVVGNLRQSPCNPSAMGVVGICST